MKWKVLLVDGSYALLRVYEKNNFRFEIISNASHGKWTGIIPIWDVNITYVADRPEIISKRLHTRMIKLFKRNWKSIMMRRLYNQIIKVGFKGLSECSLTELYRRKY